MKKVIVGMSGGVDSSVAAILLKEQGYDVEGVTMILNDKNDCEDAKKICKELNIKHHILNLKNEFNELVIQRFIDECNRGLTPNPCVMCNKYFKFGLMYDKLLELNFDYIATGHYAIIENNQLFKGKDSNKDQSYFLSQLSKKQLSKILFPLGNLDKNEVREIAKKNGLFVSEKKGSTGACFIGEGHYKEFISNNFSNKIGDIINIDTNKKVGEHTDLMYYTIGQRRGLDIGGTLDRLFVVGKNIEKNILYVAENDKNNYLYSTSCIINDLNITINELPETCNAKFRYRSNDVKVRLDRLNDNELLVSYDNTKSITPGQLCCLYIDNKCIGSGMIKEVQKDNKKLWYLL